MVDGHNDLPWALRSRSSLRGGILATGRDLTEPQPDLHTDLPGPQGRPYAVVDSGTNYVKELF